MPIEPPPVDANAEPYRPLIGSLGRGRDTPFFTTPELKQRLDLLRHLTDNSEKLLLVKGPEGAGKSVFLQQYREQAREPWDVCCLEASHMLQPEQLYALLFRRYGLNAPAELTVGQLINRFEMLHAAGRLPVIVIDEAHLLPAATVIALFRLFERRPGSRALIRVILFATPEIAALLQTPQLQAMNLQIIQSFELPPFNPEQSRAFIDFLLGTGQGGQRLQIDPGRIKRIVRESMGLPGEIERRLQEYLNDEPPPSSAKKTSAEAGPRTLKWPPVTDLPVSVLVGGLLLGILLILTLIFQDEINRLFQEPQRSLASHAPRPGEGGTRPLPLPPRSERQVDAAEPPVQATTPEAPPVPEEPPTLTLPDLAGTAPAPNAVPAETSVPNEPIKPPPADPAVAERQQSVGASSAPSVEPIGETPAESSVAPVERPAAIIESAPEEAGETAIVEPQRSVESPAAGIVQPVPSPAPSTVKKPVAEKPVTRNARWLLEQNPTDYTLQLVGVSEERAAQQFIEQHQLDDEARYIRSLRNGKPWYSVLYGVYPDPAAANRGKRSLPPSLQGQGAWARTFASLQEGIK